MTSSIKANRIIGIFLSGVPTKETRNNLTTDGSTLYLYGSAIARWNAQTGELSISLAGVPSKLTVRRVNEVLRVSGSVFRVHMGKLGNAVMERKDNGSPFLVFSPVSLIKVPDVNLKAQRTKAMEDRLCEEAKSNN